MLRQLYIKNFTLIDELDITFQSGFSVVTGETGAGKSIILGAIGLLLGNRADLKQIKTGQERCIVEAHFDIRRYDLSSFFKDNDIDYDASDCIVRREVNVNGKSRAFINDTPVSLAQMRELGDRLVDIHSQHQNLLLNKADFQLSVVDIIAEDKVQLEDYRETWRQYQKVVREMEAYQQQLELSRQNEDFLRFQLNELTEAALCNGEEEELESQSQTMSHAEEIKSSLYEADLLLNDENSGIIMNLRRLMGKLGEIEKVCSPVIQLNERVDSCCIELKDIAADISTRLEATDFDPRQLDSINERLDLIYTLQKKYHVDTIAELLETQQQIARQLQSIDNSDIELQELQWQVAQLEEDCRKKSQALSDLRKKASRQIEKEMQSRLIPLGIPNVRFQVQLSEKPLSVNGGDDIAFLFSANKDTPLQPVSMVASGGEIARVMLSLKAMISGAVKLPTIIFDEIDTGVSGRVAEQMAHIMNEMGNNDRQVISITHLPQIAALGTSHYRVVKEETPQGTQSRMIQLSFEERVTEIAQMVSGSEVSEAAIANARQLLKKVEK